MASASVVPCGERRESSRLATRKLVWTMALATLACVALLVFMAPGVAFAATPPAISGISPDTGSSSGANSVVITGTGFTGLAGASAVSFGGSNAAGYTVDSETQITAITPAHAAGKVRVLVTAAGGATPDTAADDFTFMNRYDQTDSRFSYAPKWDAFTKDSAFDGSYARTNVSNAAVSITFSGQRLDWIAMEGTTTGSADVYLDNVFQTTVNLASPSPIYQQRVWSTGTVASGVHKVKIIRSPGNAATAYITIDAVEVVGSLVQSGRIEQTDTRLAYAGTWSTFSTSGPSAGSYKRANTSTASVTVDFNGTYLAWIATKGKTLGKAWVSLDGGTAQTVDLAAPKVAYQQTVWDTHQLNLGDHEVKISWDKTDNAAGIYISIDAFEIQGTLSQAYLWNRFEQSDSRLLYTGTWSTTPAPGASGGSYKEANTSAASLTATFSGTRLDWIATTGPGMGRADVSIDDGPAETGRPVQRQHGEPTEGMVDRSAQRGYAPGGDIARRGQPFGRAHRRRRLRRLGDVAFAEVVDGQRDQVGGAAAGGPLLSAGRHRRRVRFPNTLRSDRVPEMGRV